MTAVDAQTLARPRISNGKFLLIEAGRGMAAILVVLHHTGNIMAQPRFYGAEPFGRHFRNFNVGVDFFFILSGFIIAWIHWSDIGLTGRLNDFARKRFLRIFPPYWVILLFLIFLYQLVPTAGVDWERDPINIFLSIFLLPNPAQPILGVAWTLTHEILFYAIFGTIVAVGPRLLWLFPFWALAIISWNICLPIFTAYMPEGTSYFPLSFLLSDFNLEFLIGVGVAWILKMHRVPVPMLFMASGALIFAAVTLFATDVQSYGLYGRMAFAIPAAFFVLGAVEYERRLPVQVPRILVILGSASYAVYLIHSVALSFLLQILSRVTGRDVNLDGVALGLAAMAIGVGIIYHYVVERRSISQFFQTNSKTAKL